MSVAELFVMRTGVATTSGRVEAKLLLAGSFASLKRILQNTVGSVAGQESQTFGQTHTLLAAQTAEIRTSDGSVAGTADYVESVIVTEFDA